jgi:hypothetical protein
MTVHYITDYCSYAVRSRGLDVSYAGDKLVVEVVPRQHEDDWKSSATIIAGRTVR